MPELQTYFEADDAFTQELNQYFALHFSPSETAGSADAVGGVDDAAQCLKEDHQKNCDELV